MVSEQTRGQAEANTARVELHITIEGRLAGMWARNGTAQRVKPGKGDDLANVIAHLKAAEQPGSGLVHSTATLDESPSRVIMYVVFGEQEGGRTGAWRTTSTAKKSSGQPGRS